MAAPISETWPESACRMRLSFVIPDLPGGDTSSSPSCIAANSQNPQYPLLYVEADNSIAAVAANIDSSIPVRDNVIRPISCCRIVLLPRMSVHILGEGISWMAGSDGFGLSQQNITNDYPFSLHARRLRMAADVVYTICALVGLHSSRLPLEDESRSGNQPWMHRMDGYLRQVEQRPSHPGDVTELRNTAVCT